MKLKLSLLLLVFALQAEPENIDSIPTIILDQEEFNEIEAASEPYVYLGSKANDILQDFQKIKNLSDESICTKNIDEICALIKQDRTTAPVSVVKAALEEAYSCLKDNNQTSEEIDWLSNCLNENYNDFFESEDSITRSRKLRKFCNVIVKRKLITGELTVCGNAVIHGNEIVEGTLTVNNLIVIGNITITGCLTTGCIISNTTITGQTLIITGSAFIGGDLIVEGCITASCFNGNLNLSGCLSVSCLNVFNNANISGCLSVSCLNVNNSTNIGRDLIVGGCITTSCLNLSGCLTVSCLNVINNANIGGNLNVTGTIFGTTEILTQTLIVQNATFTNFIPSYAPLSAAMTTSVAFFGDSIAVGSGLPSPETQRWPALVSQFFGTTERNFAVSGAMINDSPSQIYLKYPPGSNNTTFQAFGWNDVPYTADADTIWDELRRTTEAMVLFTTLPDSQKVNAQDAPHSAGWAPIPGTFGNWGLQTVGNTGQTIQATVTGRFVCFSMSANTNTIFWDIDIDGIKLPNETPLTPPQPFVRNSPNTQNGGQFNAAVFVYDTGSSNTATHTITITYNAASTAPGYIIWFGGFNLNNPNCNTTFVPSVGLPDWVYFATIAPALNSGMERRRQTWSYIQRTVCRRLRTEYGLPVYFVDMSYPWTFGMMQHDTYHPNPNGHRYMANRAIDVVLFGEFNYLT